MSTTTLTAIVEHLRTFANDLEQFQQGIAAVPKQEYTLAEAVARLKATTGCKGARITLKIVAKDYYGGDKFTFEVEGKDYKDYESPSLAEALNQACASFGPTAKPAENPVEAAQAALDDVSVPTAAEFEAAQAVEIKNAPQPL